jgi:hypothetical protein
MFEMAQFLNMDPIASNLFPPFGIGSLLGVQRLYFYKYGSKFYTMEAQL